MNDDLLELNPHLKAQADYVAAKCSAWVLGAQDSQERVLDALKMENTAENLAQVQEIFLAIAADKKELAQLSEGDRRRTLYGRIQASIRAAQAA